MSDKATETTAATDAAPKGSLADIALRWVELRHHKAGSDRSATGDTDADLDERVKHALDMTTIACCEHIRRLMSGDL